MNTQPTFWQRTKRRAVTALAAGAAGAAAAYCVYTWYTTAPPSDSDAAPSSSGAGPSGASCPPSSPPQPPPLLPDPHGSSSSASMDAAAHLRHHFDSIQQIADATTLPSLLPALARAVAACDGIDAALERLRLAKAGELSLRPEEKKELWEDLAAAALARTVVACWAYSLLALQVRVQLNVLGRHLYLETALCEPNDEALRRPWGNSPLSRPRTLSPPSQEAFLSYTEHLAKAGHEGLVAAARRAATAALVGTSLAEVVDEEALGGLLSRALSAFARETREGGAGGGPLCWADFLLPPPAALRQSLLIRRADDRALLPGAESLLVDVDAVGAMVDEVGRILGSERFSDTAVVCAREVSRCVAEDLIERLGGGAVPLAKLVPLLVAEANAVLSPRARCAAAVAALPQVASLSSTVYACGPPL